MQLRGAMVYVKDFPWMRAFYSALLGSEPVNQERQDTWAEFESGGARFALHAIPPDIAERIEIQSPPRPREQSPVKLIFSVDDVIGERARLEALGITMVQRPWQQPAEACDGIDPEGNVFQIARA